MEGGKTEMDLPLLQYFGHEHPLLFVQDHPSANNTGGEEYALCGCCGKQVEGPSYCCSESCKFSLHKNCAELELAPQINHPFHPKHPLTLTPKPDPKPDGRNACYYCRRSILGFNYRCDSCDFDLDVNCALFPPSITENLSSSLHGHPLALIENHKEEVDHDCRACKKHLSGPIYKCLDCLSFYLHKECGELSLQINHPLHPRHPLTLITEETYGQYRCNYCRRSNFGFNYRCDSCDFDLDVNCALFQPSITENLSSSLHDHPLTLIENHKVEVDDDCRACKKHLSGPIYKCLDCLSFYLHKECGELSLQINHPLHPKHPLTLIPEETYGSNRCKYCCRDISGFNYRCDSCDFDLDVNCASFQPSIIENFSSCFHNHPLILIENHKEEVNNDCRACTKLLSGPIYKCLDCVSFYFHKECGELSAINHPCDRAHPLSPLINARAAHQDKCSCYLCKIKWDGLAYCCSICNIQLPLEDATAPLTITAATHEHPWTLLMCQISFTCQFCGTDGYVYPYICTTCHLVVHKKCISLPSTIRIARHPHPISHAYSLQHNQPEELQCKICYTTVNARYGIYRCSAFNCDFIAHVNCATDEDIWDGTVVHENDDKISKGAATESLNMITDVISQVTQGEDVIATEIKHAYHEHNLVLTFKGEIKDDNNCDGCLRPISIPFYECQRCKFFLHKSCAELPREKGHATHKHLLKLSNNDGIFRCDACTLLHHGFSYKCDQEECDFGEIDVQCSLQPDTLRHPSHEHPLFLTHKLEGRCSGCANRSSPAYGCTKRCDFVLDFHCLSQPLTVGYKYDKHPLTLTFNDNSDPSQIYCDFCEEERDSKQWFYHCARCDNSLHRRCALGDLPLIKLGRTYKCIWTHSEHPLTFVDNIWDSPPCNECGELCYRQALECKESGCNFTAHWHCGW